MIAYDIWHSPEEASWALFESSSESNRALCIVDGSHQVFTFVAADWAEAKRVYDVVAFGCDE